MQSPAVQGDKQVPEADKVRGDETLPLENPPTPAPRNAEGTPAAAGEAAGGDSAKQRLQEGESPHQAKKADAGDEQGLSEEEILRQVEERQRKEQQELEKKTGLVEGEDGQFVDPELQEEMKKDE
ncbi:MAG: hypothetical protein D6806_11285 [Deltaproteobacteria bacterium]|nr:MAG: hypothetical protein D6806_11285 [Deltaproteobacteria bacterium]